jgi:hypothetical protein
MKKHLLFLLLLSLSFKIIGQTPIDPRGLNGEPQSDWCPTDKLQAEMLKNNPAFKQQQEQFEQLYQRAMTLKQTSPYGLNTRAVSTLPVVIHIFHSGQAVGSTQNPSDDMMKLWIQKTSDRFRHTSGAVFANNSFSGIDCEINLCLSRKDPSGNPSSGINRYNIPSLAVLPSAFDPTAFNPYMWDKTKYCNMIIVTSPPPDHLFAGVTFPGSNLDFTVYVSTSMGTPSGPNSGLAAHELGHYFNLEHTFQGGCPNNTCLTVGDKVCDTPPKDAPGIPSGASCAAPSNTCATDDDDLTANNPFRPVVNGGIGDRLDGLENYMDYTGSCWGAFTQGQKARMQVNLTTRTGLTGNSAACNVIITLQLSAKVFLQGPYNATTGLMNDDLRTKNLIPSAQPYSALTGFSHSGTETLNPSILATTGNDAIVDWVFIQLRDKNNAAMVVASRAALLQRDGDIVDVNGTSPVTFSIAPDNYFVAIRHRNHLGMRTVSSIALSNSATSLDFTTMTIPSVVYGTNPLKDLGGKLGLYMGNVIQDGILKYSGSSNDRLPILTKIGGTNITATVNGYFSEDCNMDGVVKYSGSSNDRLPILTNIGGTNITATIQEQF